MQYYLFFRKRSNAHFKFISRQVYILTLFDLLQVAKALRTKFGDLYTDENVLITATHTHATPGGHLQYLLYLIPSQGFIRQTFFSLVKGIVKVSVLSAAERDTLPASVIRLAQTNGSCATK